MRWLKHKILKWLEIDEIKQRLHNVECDKISYDDAEQYTDDAIESAMDSLSIYGEDITSVVEDLSGRVDDLAASCDSF